MRRILMVLTVAALMAALMVASAMPVFAFESKPTKSQGSAVGKLESSFTANGSGTFGTPGGGGVGGPGSISEQATRCGQCNGEFFSALARQ